jgi:hypothetical protein
MVEFYNLIPGQQTTHVWGPSSTAPNLALVGLGSNDNPSGTTLFGAASAMALIGSGGSGSPYGYATTLAQLLAAPGADQPQSNLAPSGQTTTFRTSSKALGLLVGISDTLNNVPLDAPVATLQMVAWDNSSGSYPTWTEALPAWRSGLIAAGEAPPINVTNIGGPMNYLPYLVGLQSFNLYFGSPPVVVCKPPAQTAEQGSTVTWSAQASGSPPLDYQWFLNGTNVPANPATNQMTLSNAQFSLSGAWTVVVTNLFGAVTSSPAMLGVIAPVERRPVPGVKVTGQPGSVWDVVYASSLSPVANWSVLGSVSLSITPQYCFDLTVPLPPQRFYRAQETADPLVFPVLGLSMVPAITLTGSIGGSVRVDYINRFGPTDAWVTLATVTLTNTSQLYFDLSAPGQPQRLYRIVPTP